MQAETNQHAQPQVLLGQQKIIIKLDKHAINNTRFDSTANAVDNKQVGGSIQPKYYVQSAGAIGSIMKVVKPLKELAWLKLNEIRVQISGPGVTTAGLDNTSMISIPGPDRKFHSLTTKLNMMMAKNRMLEKETQIIAAPKTMATIAGEPQATSSDQAKRGESSELMQVDVTDSQCAKAPLTSSTYESTLRKTLNTPAKTPNKGVMRTDIMHFAQAMATSGCQLSLASSVQSGAASTVQSLPRPVNLKAASSESMRVVSKQQNLVSVSTQPSTPVRISRAVALTTISTVTPEPARVVRAVYCDTPSDPGYDDTSDVRGRADCDSSSAYSSPIIADDSSCDEKRSIDGDSKKHSLVHLQQLVDNIETKQRVKSTNQRRGNIKIQEQPPHVDSKLTRVVMNVLQTAEQQKNTVNSTAKPAIQTAKRVPICKFSVSTNRSAVQSNVQPARNHQASTTAALRVATAGVGNPVMVQLPPRAPGVSQQVLPTPLSIIRVPQLTQYRVNPALTTMTGPINGWMEPVNNYTSQWLPPNHNMTSLQPNVTYVPDLHLPVTSQHYSGSVVQHQQTPRADGGFERPQYLQRLTGMPEQPSQADTWGVRTISRKRSKRMANGRPAE